MESNKKKTPNGTGEQEQKGTLSWASKMTAAGKCFEVS